MWKYRTNHTVIKNMQQGKENELLGVILHASSTTTGLIDR
jgi:hypothetical protein